MTVKNLFKTLDCCSYDQIVVHWPTLDDDREFNEISFDSSESLIELFGSINIMTMDETFDYDGGDASLFVHKSADNQIIIHIYFRREDIIHDNT